MVAGCGIVFFFLIKRAKAAYCENEKQIWEVVERKYLRKRNKVILLYTFVLIIFYLFVFFWMKGKGISFPKEEKIFFLIYFLIFFPITFYIECPIYRYEVVEESSETCIRLYQNIGTAQNIIGKVVTTITYNSKDSLTDYYVKKVEFKKN